MPGCEKRKEIDDMSLFYQISSIKPIWFLPAYKQSTILWQKRFRRRIADN
jgi:hypothetical protein